MVLKRIVLPEEVYIRHILLVLWGLLHMNYALTCIYRSRLQAQREVFLRSREEARHRAGECGAAVWPPSTVGVNQLMEDTRLLSKIETALEAIVDGSYGRCRLCQHEITARRLHRFPWAAHCNTCNDLAETRIMGLRQRRAYHYAGGLADWISRWLSKTFYASFHGAR